MKIDTLGVQAFVAIAEGGSFRQAAQTLNVTQTAITQRLRKLESYLGVVLVERTTRHCALTEIGERFLPQARRLLGELADALTEIRETGRMIAYAFSIMLPRMCALRCSDARRNSALVWRANSIPS